jgi:hypothetical protein
MADQSKDIVEKVRLDEGNRTERFWTATVIPALLSRNSFQGVRLFLELIAQDGGRVPFEDRQEGKGVSLIVDELCREQWNYENLQLTTELWFARDFSEHTEFAVPDVVLRLRKDYLIVVEAKFFQRVKESAIKQQLDRQKETVGDIVKVYPDIRYVHYCFLHGGADPVGDNIGAHSRVTWKDVWAKFKGTSGSSSGSPEEDYFVKILGRAIENYDEEFSRVGTDDRAEYYVDKFNLVDLLGALGQRREEAFIGLGVGSPATAEETLSQLVSAAKEEMSHLQRSIREDAKSFPARPKFLCERKYDNQSAIEYLFVHSSQGYKVDYVNGSGDDKTKNTSWLDGARFVQILTQLTLPERHKSKKRGELPE